MPLCTGALGSGRRGSPASWAHAICLVQFGLPQAEFLPVCAIVSVYHCLAVVFLLSVPELILLCFTFWYSSSVLELILLVVVNFDLFLFRCLLAVVNFAPLLGFCLP